MKFSEIKLLKRAIVEGYQEAQVYKEIKRHWETLMDGLSKNNAMNNIEQPYELLETFPKHYGFDAIISIPTGKNLNEFRKLLPSISAHFRGDVIAEYSDNKSSIYLRCHMNEYDIEESDDIKFKWYMMFGDGKYRNNNGETFMLVNGQKIYHPTEKEKAIGYRYELKIPEGLSYSTLESCLIDLNNLFGVCSLKFNKNTKKASIEIVRNRLSDNEKFKPLKVKPWELYIGMTHSLSPIILDFKKDPNAIFGGKTNSGKTLAMLTGILNLCLNCSSDTVQLFIGMISDKQDLRVFKNIEHCQYYADTINKVYAMLTYLSLECSKRNRLFAKADDKGSIVNVHEYNNSRSKKEDKLPLLYLCFDEIASLSENGTEMSKREVALKAKCSALVWKLAREGRSAGIYVNMATQRGDVKNLDANIKSNLGNQVGFYFANMPSAQTILGDSSLASLCTTNLEKQREFICRADEVYFGKTLYLTLDDIIKYLEPLYVADKHHLELDLNQKLFVSEKDTKSSEKGDKNNEFEHFFDILDEENDENDMKFETIKEDVLFANSSSIKQNNTSEVAATISKKKKTRYEEWKDGK